ncbi:unnamed protein product [Effrenium voratum]|nr:unnamed protein product [Effrenium voratum]
MEGTKPCPGCKCPTEKTEGCNHMECPSCRCNWCWTCGTELAGRLSLGWHYSAANPSGCMQFSALGNHANSRMTLLARAIAFPGTLLGFLIFWTLLPTWFLCGAGLVLTVLVLIGLECAWCSSTLPCVCGLCCCGLQVEQAEIILCAPCFSCYNSMNCLLGA